MRSIMMTITAGFMALSLAACDQEQSTSERQEQTRTEVLDRADRSVQVPQINNFIARQTVADFMTRVDQPNKLFYVYILADTGNYIGYYVARNRPVNICNNMTPPDRVDGTHERRRVRAAPSLNGLYNAGSGTCEIEYFFDSETDSLIMIKGLNLFISDQPLELDVQPIRVAQ